MLVICTLYIRVIRGYIATDAVIGTAARVLALRRRRDG